MMPIYVCKRCCHEFAGWGVHYISRNGNRLICPDCSGNLAEKVEVKAPAVKQDDAAERHIKGDAA